MTPTYPVTTPTAESKGKEAAPSWQDKSLEIFSLDLCSKERARESSYCCRCSPSVDREGERFSVGF